MIEPNEKTTVNITLKLKNKNLVKVENFLNDSFELISFKNIKETSKMYLEDKMFKKLVKQRKELNNVIHDYIMKNNHKY